MQHFRNDEREFSYDPFKIKSKFDLKRKDASIELYLPCLKGEISSLGYKVGDSNLTKGERDVVYSLKNNNSVIIKETFKGPAFVVWDKDGYLKEAKTQVNEKMFMWYLKEMWKVPLRK